MHEHDAEPGKLTRCQITGSDNLNLVIDLGNQPACDALRGPDDPEVSYPLALWICPDSGLAQLDFVVPGEEVYPPEYPYRSGISKPVRDHQTAFADSVISKFPTSKPNPLAVDIGSNDGTLLTGFKAKGWRALGVEPTNVAKIARDENGIATIQEFFTEELAQNLMNNYGTPSIITMTNVFAHMASLGEVMRGLCRFLRADKESVFITESHYLLDVLEKNQFDTIYHEHLRTYSLMSLCVLADMYDLEVFDVERAPRYGGNIRAYFAQKGARKVQDSVPELLLEETAKGLYQRETWLAWRSRIYQQRDRMMEFIYRERLSGKTFAGCSAPGRAATLINFYGIRRDVVPYLGELENSLKLNKYLPGAGIPIVKNTRLIEEQPDYVILFSWHYAEVIVQRLRSEGLRSKLIVPLPEFAVL